MTLEKTLLPFFLNKIYSDKKAIEILNILDAIRPTHNERLWMTSFLRYAGYSMDEVLGIIREHAQWADYNERITSYQVGTIYHKQPQRTQGTTHRKPRKFDLTPVEVLRIRRQASINLSKLLCEESNSISFPHPERLGHFNSWSEFLRK